MKRTPKLLSQPKFIFATILFLIVAAITFNACQKAFSTKGKDEDFVLNAKRWFNKTYNDKLVLDSKGEPKFGKYPDWRFIKLTI